MNDRKQTAFIGQRQGGDTEEERENFYICAACGQAVDMRDLRQVLHHENAGHEPIDCDA